MMLKRSLNGTAERGSAAFQKDVTYKRFALGGRVSTLEFIEISAFVHWHLQPLRSIGEI